MLNFDKYLKKVNEGSYTEDDIISIIKDGGKIYTTSVYDFPDHNEDLPLRPIEVSDGIVLIQVDNDIYKIDLENINQIERNEIS
jgi:hypothetical protein